MAFPKKAPIEMKFILKKVYLLFIDIDVPHPTTGWID
jgi:hypothetical protein